MKKIREKFNRISAVNNKGFSLVELVVVIAIIMALVIVVAGSFSLIYRSKAKSAIQRVGAMMSQSKVNALSGIPNELEFYYNSEKNVYVCKLINTSTGTEYKTEEIGTSRLDISFVGDGGSENIQNGKKLVLSFSKSTGEVEELMFGEDDFSASSSVDITFSMENTYTLRLYTLTGEHEIL